MNSKKKITLGNINIGGNAAISVQSMTNTRTKDSLSTIKQINKLSEAGADIVRLGIPEMEDAYAIGDIIKETDIPLIADIHFNYKLALECLQQGIHGLRLNPGNMRKKIHVKEVINMASSCKIPVRIGINGGSLPKDLLEKYGEPTAQAMVEAAIREIEYFRELDFENYKVSLKSSSVLRTIEAYELFSKENNCPLHVGITEAGIKETGLIRSSYGIGSLLHKGIGDTIRVSLTADPVHEIHAGIYILKMLGIKKYGE